MIRHFVNININMCYIYSRTNRISQICILLTLTAALLFFSIGYDINLLSNMSLKESSNKIVGLNFEVSGKVQGVFFRKHTQAQAQKLNLRGWCMNTREGTVKGQMEGNPQNVENMKHWLRSVGSPSSVIKRAEFSSEKTLTKHQFSEFKILR